jgi:hypothetical protein
VPSSMGSGGAELLVSASASDDEIAALRQSGLPARRAAWLMLDDDLSSLDAIAAALENQALVMITSRMLGRVADELDGIDSAMEWIRDQADRVNKPVAVMVPRADLTGGRIAFLSPAAWSHDRLRGWVAGHNEELEELFGRTSVRAMSTATEIRPRRVRRVKQDEPSPSLADAERELDQVRARLTSELRTRRPDLFDGSGRPKRGALEQAVQEHTGKKKLSRADILELLRKKSS